MMTSMVVVVDDILDQLLAENKRLLKELLFANKCLKIFDELKTELNLIYKKFETQLITEDKFNHLRHQLNLIYRQKRVEKDLAADDNNKYNLKPAKVVITSCGNDVIDIQDINGLSEEPLVICEPQDIQLHEVVIDGTQEENVGHYGQHVLDIISGEQFEETVVETQIDDEVVVVDDCTTQSMSSTIGHSVVNNKNQNKTKNNQLFEEITDLSGYTLRCLYKNCYKKFRLKNTLLHHQSAKHHIKRRKLIKHKCHYNGCQFGSTNVTEFVKHMKDLHQEDKPFACDYDNCDKSYKTFADLRSHREDHSTYRQLQETNDTQLDDEIVEDTEQSCQSIAKQSLINKSKTETNQLFEEITNDSSGYMFRCLYRKCYKKFRIKNTLLHHQSAKHNIKRRKLIKHKCHYNGCQFRSKSVLEFDKHMKVVHKEDNPLMADIKTNANQLFEKINDSTDGYILRCLYNGCYKKFKIKETLLRHLTAKHYIKRRNTIKQKCNYSDCQFVSENVSQFAKHMKDVHKEIKRFACHYDSCNKSFRCQNDLKLHQKWHINVKRFASSVVSDNRRVVLPTVVNKTVKQHNRLNHKIIDDTADDDDVEVDDINNYHMINRSDEQLQETNESQISNDDDVVEDGVNSVQSFIDNHINILFDEIADSFGNKFRCLYRDCYKKFKMKKTLLRHLKDKHDITRRNLMKQKCRENDCQFITTNVRQFVKHMKDVHQVIKRFDCNYDNCNKSFRCSNDLKLHQKCHINVKRLDHKTIDDNANDYDVEVDNINNHHMINTCNEQLQETNDDEVVADDVNSVQSLIEYNDMNTLFEEIVDSFGNKFRCLYRDCYKKFRIKNTLIRHLRDKHDINKNNGQKHHCPVNGCQRVLLTKFKLKRHFRLYHMLENVEFVDGFFICKYPNCNRKYKRKHIVQNHQRWEHEGQPRPNYYNKKNYKFKCHYDGCTHSCLTEDQLKRHISSVHLLETLFHCTIGSCQKAFKLRQSLDRHVMAHNQQTLVCSYGDCRQKFTTMIAFRYHMLEHTKTATVKCTEPGCELMFINQTHLKWHKCIVHRIRKQYLHRCPWPGCDYYGRNITQHKSVHTGVKRYACVWPKCGKSFNNPGDLEGHMNVHKNIKPYACTWPGCDYRCAHSTGLQHHRKIHTNSDVPIAKCAIALVGNCVKLPQLHKARLRKSQL